MTRWSLFLQTPSLLHHFLGLYWLFDAGHRISDLSKRYRVHRAVVSRIVHRQTHTEVPDGLEPLDVTRR